MPERLFELNDFLEYEDESTGLDFFAEPGKIRLAKDPSALLIGMNTEIDRLLTSEGLIQSYGLENNDPVNVINRTKTNTVDNALAALYFFLNGEEDKAKKIYQHYLSILPATFTPNQDQVPDWINLKDSTTGPTEALSVAYLLYSVAYYQFISQNTQFRQLALFCAEHLLDLKDTNFNLVTDNYSTNQISSEPNVISYLGLKLLVPFTNNSDILDFADDISDSLVNNLGIKEHPNLADISASSVIHSGLFANSMGHKFLLKSTLDFIPNYFLYDNDRLIGIKDSNNNLDIKLTILASVFFNRIDQSSYSNSLNTVLVENYTANKYFKPVNQESPVNLLLLFLVLNKIIEDEFITEDLFR